MVSTQSTVDYDIFKKLAVNRALDKNIVRRLKYSIQHNNLLEYRPILVNPQMEIIDGQHRLEAAKELGIPIYYQIQDEGKEEDLIFLNAYHRNWNLGDYLNYYVQKGCPNYIKFKKICESYAISPNHLLALMGKGGGGDMSHTIATGRHLFKDGKMEMPSQMEIEEVLQKKEAIVDLIQRKLPWESRRYKGSSHFTRAILLFFNFDSVDFSVFIRKLEINLNLLRVCTSVKDYIICFQSIYNWKNQSPVNVVEAF